MHNNIFKQIKSNNKIMNKTNYKQRNGDKMILS